MLFRSMHHRHDRYAHYHNGIKFYNWPYAMGWFLVHNHWHKLLMTHGSFTGSNALLMIKQNGTIYAALFNKKPSGINALPRFRKKLMDLFLRETV